MKKVYLSFILLCSCSSGAASELAPTETQDASGPPAMQEASVDVVSPPMMEAGSDACYLTGCQLTPFGVWQCDHATQPPLPGCTVVNHNACVDIYLCKTLSEAGAACSLPTDCASGCCAVLPSEEQMCETFAWCPPSCVDADDGTCRCVVKFMCVNDQ